MSNGLPRPLVYACSGASSAAQMANHVAVKLDRLGIGENVHQMRDRRRRQMIPRRLAGGTA